jgi:plastocyanin
MDRSFRLVRLVWLAGLLGVIVGLSACSPQAAPMAEPTADPETEAGEEPAQTPGEVPTSQPTPGSATPTRSALPPVMGVTITPQPTQEQPSATPTSQPSPQAASTATSGAQPTASSAATVSIGDSRFDRREITVAVGTTVTWQHEGARPHTVTADDGLFASGTLAEGDSFSFTFTQPGTYKYYCEFHGGKNGQGMSGVVTVTASGS